MFGMHKCNTFTHHHQQQQWRYIFRWTTPLQTNLKTQAEKRTGQPLEKLTAAATRYARARILLTWETIFSFFTILLFTYKILLLLYTQTKRYRPIDGPSEFYYNHNITVVIFITISYRTMGMTRLLQYIIYRRTYS